ncbi:hypothetical protein [Sinorhizobium americanum]|uniref:hypothetical protein n=1 Tax=Sinorhizobium americanum TaxID=194963 RepID=UPI0004DA1144|nr:hypothetical protein [Sinorhizobium americanum]APG88101.1 hypothetical protein SAMCCGM7_pC0904 [Sinorhizobium americanum CCGM7]
MTAAMLVMEPIFEADLPPELYAYRARRNAQQAVTKVEEERQSAVGTRSFRDAPASPNSGARRADVKRRKSSGPLRSAA